MVSLIIWARGINMTNMNGILRAGGDTIGAASIDVGMLWLFGVPLALIVSMVLGWPFWALFAVVCLEEVIKTVLSIARVRTYKWAKRLV
jgi:Na+-driven multidrug efflux pump